MIAIDKLSPEQLERFLHIQSIIDRQEDAARRVVAYGDYYDGRHPILLTDRQREYIGDLLSEDNFTFCYNATKIVVDKVRERLNVTGFSVNGSAAGDETPAGQIAALLWEWWKANGMEAEQIRSHRRSLRDAYSYVMVSYDSEKGQPDYSLHEVWNGTSGVTFHRDPGNMKKVLFANRYFYTYDPLSPGVTGKLRKTTYLSHEIRKYQQNGSAINQWSQILDDGDAGWPLPWRDRAGRPLGIALIEIPNPGGSEIEQVIGPQNGLNKALLDLMAAADASGFPIIAVEYNEAGVAIESDDDLEGTDELRIGPGRLLEVDAARIHRIEGADLDQLIGLVWTMVAIISSISSVPQYHFRPFGGSEIPSGEALKTLESGLVKKAEERQLIFGQAWKQVCGLAYRVAQTFGNVPTLAGELTIDVQWADANVRNETVEIGVAEGLQRLEVPKEIVWQRAGLTPEQIAKAKEQARSDRVADVAAMASAIQLQATRNAPQTNPRTGVI